MRRAVALVLMLVSAALAAAPPTPSERAEKTLDDIFRSKNDNDPRLDREFNALTPETKSLFRRKYRRLPPERRNERGTIVYLMGKNAVTPEDWAFLSEIAGESPCLSLLDCAKAPGPDEDLPPGNEVTLAYPALVALKQAQRALEAVSADAGASAAAIRARARAVLEAGKKSRVRIVKRTAAGIGVRF